MKSIGLIGCGVVGQELGGRLLRAGFELRVHDRHREKADALVARGATWAASPAALGHECDAVVSALPSGEDVLDALVGPAGAWTDPRRGALHVDTSTIGVACARGLAAEARSRRIGYLDAPLSAAEATETGGRLALFVSGNADHFDRARGVLEVLADHVHFFGGPPGKGQVVKLVNNLTSHSLLVALADALAMGLKAGLSVDLLRAALHDGTAQNRLLDELLPASALRGDWRPGLRLDLALKDLRLAEELSEETGVAQRLLGTVRSAHEQALQRFGNAGSHSVLRLVEESADVSFRSSVFGDAAG